MSSASSLSDSSGSSGFLSNVDILQAIKERKISITPFQHSRLGSWTYDVELGNVFRVPKHTNVRTIDPRSDNHEDFFEVLTIQPNGEFILHPHRFVLAHTQEYIKLNEEVVCILEGRSSFARWGVIPHVQAGIGEPGWEGQYTLEIMNMNEVPVVLRPGDVVAQLYFCKFITPTDNPYWKKESKKYQAQTGPVGSKLFMDFKQDQI